MKILPLKSYIVFGGVALITACSSATDSRLSPTGPSFHVDVQDRILTVCKSGPVGTYEFTASLDELDFNPGDVLYAGFTIEVTDPAVPACREAFRRSESDTETSDEPIAITVTELPAAGTTLQSIDFTSVAAAGSENEAERTVTVWVNAFHDASATFTNVAVPEDEGCTYTQGWYKNPKHQWPAGDWTNFDGTGVSYLGILNTPPKGNVYYILAHQYIAATLNVAGGASDDDITQALADAAAYFAVASPNNPVPGSYTKDQVTAIAGALDAYNNGVTGPGHCGDEELAVD